MYGYRRWDIDRYVWMGPAVDAWDVEVRPKAEINFGRKKGIAKWAGRTSYPSNAAGAKKLK